VAIAHLTEPGSHGRERVLDAAERLLDERGIDGVSARAIAVEAGHRNTAAVNYHFGDRDELVHAVLSRRADQLDEQRHQLFDELEASGPVTARAALTAILRPLVELLADESGRRHLRLLNQAANHPAYYARVNLQFNTGLARGAVYVLPLVEHLSPERRPHRANVGLGMALHALADQSRLVDVISPPRPVLDREELLDDLVETELALLSA
jgi:AcrR family transcriptional regulator